MGAELTLNIFRIEVYYEIVEERLPSVDAVTRRISSQSQKQMPRTRGLLSQVVAARQFFVLRGR